MKDLYRRTFELRRAFVGDGGVDVSAELCPRPPDMVSSDFCMSDGIGSEYVEVPFEETEGALILRAFIHVHEPMERGIHLE